MTVMTNVVLVLKDSEGNIGIVKTLTDNDIIKIANAITDVGQVVDPATHMPIEATTSAVGVVQLATAQDITNGTANKVVDAQELNNFAQTLPAANGVTDVSSGDNSNQLVVSRIGGSKTLTIDNVEHASNADEATHASQADTATFANSVAWDNVSGKPTKVSQFTNDSNYLTGITKAMVTTALGYTPPTSDTNTHYTTTLYAGAKDAKSNAATTNGNAYLKLYDDSTVRSQLNIKGSGATTVTTDANGVITISSTDTNTTYSKLSQFTNDKGYITGITKAMVTDALGYTPPTQDTNTWNALKGSTTSAAGTAGYAPAPAAGAANRYLRCDGTWQVPPDNNTTYSVATTSANGLMSSSDKTKLNKCVTTDSIWIG